MAAIDFPNSPTNGQVFTSGGMSWTYVAGVGWTLNSAIVDAGSGFTFIQDTMPLPVNVGDTWFDNSTGASGGTSWVAIEEGPVGSEKNWVQFAPGIGGSPAPGDRLWQSTAKVEHLGSFIDNMQDHSYADQAGAYPFPTVATFSISGIYLKPDRATTVNAYVWSTYYNGPESPGNGLIMDTNNPGVASGGANWTVLRALNGSVPVPANVGNIAWVLRIQSGLVGAIAWSEHWMITLERFRA